MRVLRRTQVAKVWLSHSHRLRRHPGFLQRHFPRHPVEPGAGRFEIRQGRRGDRPRQVADQAQAGVGEGAGEGGEPAVDFEQVPALVVGREGFDPELGGERREPLLGRADPLAADLDHLAVADLLVQQAAADPAAGLDHERLQPGRGEPPRGDESGETGAHDGDVGLDWLAHRPAQVRSASTRAKTSGRWVR